MPIATDDNMAIYRVELNRSAGLQLLGGGTLLGALLFVSGIVVGYSLAPDAPDVPEAAPASASAATTSAAVDDPTPETHELQVMQTAPAPDEGPTPEPRSALLPPLSQVHADGAAAAPPGRGFAVQVGAFSVKGNAEALAEDLRGRGYDPLVVLARGRSGQWLEHVHLSVYPEERLALEAARSFSVKERLPAVVVAALPADGTERR